MHHVGGILCLCEYTICLTSTLYSLTDMIRGARPLRDHVATVSGYLNHYKIQTDLELQGSHSQKFTHYLLSTCWGKISRRVASWQAMGFIFLIKSIYPDTLREFAKG